MKLLLAGYNQVLNEVLRGLFAVAVREVHLLKKLLRVHASEHGMANQILGVLKAPDSVETRCASVPHEMAVMLQLKHGIGNCKSLHRMHHMTSGHVPIEGQVRGHSLSEPHNGPIPTGEPCIILPPLSLGSLLPGHRPFIRSNSDSAENCPNATHGLYPRRPINFNGWTRLRWMFAEHRPGDNHAYEEGHHCNYRPVSIGSSLFHGFSLLLGLILPLGVAA